MKKIKIYLSLSIFILLITSCQKQEVESIQEVNSTVNKNDLLKDFEENGRIGQLFTDFQLKNNTGKSSSINREINCSSNPGINNLESCSEVHLLPLLPNTTYAWDILDNDAGYIDYELEEIFNFSDDFSYCCTGRPNGPPIQTMTGEVEFYESPSLNPLTLEYDSYVYLNSDTITHSIASELREHFACAIKEYRDTHLPNARISNVDFYGDALLCSESTLRYLKASFVLNLHTSGPIKS